MSNTIVIEGNQVDIVSLETINFARLATGEPAEVAKLLKASQTLGIFYLDLRSDSILADLQPVTRLTEKYFDQPQELKTKDYRESEERG
jgi:isopenicillin N synthase-like dioxygenase